MPIISMFYGIIVQLLFFDNDKHNRPHIHARYAEFALLLTSRPQNSWMGRSLFDSCG